MVSDYSVAARTLRMLILRTHFCGEYANATVSVCLYSFLCTLDTCKSVWIIISLKFKSTNAWLKFNYYRHLDFSYRILKFFLHNSHRNTRFTVTIYYFLTKLFKLSLHLRSPTKMITRKKTRNGVKSLQSFCWNVIN